MPKALWTVAVVGLIAVGVVGCGRGGGRSVAADACNKADTCKVLSGITAAQCQGVIDKSLGAMPSAARADAEKALDACVATAACADLNGCIGDALAGGSGGSGGSGGTPAGGGGSAAGGSGGSAAGGSGGSAAGGSSAGGSGGSSAGGSGGSTAGGSGGSSAGGSGGSSAGGSGGSKAGGSGGSTAGGSGGSSAGGSTAGGSGGGAAGGSAGGGSGGSAAGGSATGGAATGGSSSAAPEVVTSAQNAYWNTTGQVTQVASGTADVNVDKTTTYQRWDGFGGCFNEMGWDALSVVTSADVANAMKLLFDAKDGANFVYGRLPLGASDYAMSWYTLDDTAGDYAMDNFSIARDREKLIPFIKEALKVKPDLHLWASPWVLPSWMLSNSNIKTDAQTLKAHALYFARFVEDYAKEGLKIEAVHFQNEPGYGRVHGWTGSLFASYVKTYMGPTFAERNVTAEIWCGTMSKDPDDTNIAKETANDADAMKYVKGFGVQWNLQAAVATLALKGPVMQTEHTCGNYNFDTPYWKQSQYNASKPPNDHAYGEESWQLIRDWMAAGVNSYNAWNMVLDTIGKSLDGWPQDSLLVVDRSTKKVIVTPAYYAFRHFSYYIALGATRIATVGSGAVYKGASNTAFNTLNAVAFKNPDGSVIVQVYNKGASSAKTTVGVGSALSQTLYQFDVPGHGWATLRVPQ